MFKFTSQELLLRHPFKMIVAGPSASGKTSFVCNLVKNCYEMMNAQPKKLICVYRHWQPIYETFEEFGVEFVQEIPETLERDSLIILDDVMLEAGDRMASIFTKEAHHQNSSVVYLVQSVFGRKIDRLLSVNATYCVLMKSVRDKLSIATLARQVFPGQGRYFQDAYKEATSRAFSYLLLDFHPETLDKIRVRSHIFPEEAPVHIYV